MKQTPRNKAALIDFNNLDKTPKERPASFATAPGQARQNSKLRTELEKWTGATPVRQIDPKQVERSKWANRHEQSYQDEEFKALKEDIQSSGGNVQPIKVRPLAGQKDRYEVVFGHRRHQACLDLDIPVLAMIAEVDDVELFIDMDRENRQRKDMRPYELGVMYNRALKEGIFPSAKKKSLALTWAPWARLLFWLDCLTTLSRLSHHHWTFNTAGPICWNKLLKSGLRKPRKQHVRSRPKNWALAPKRFTSA